MSFVKLNIALYDILDLDAPSVMFFLTYPTLNTGEMMLTQHLWSSSLKALAN